MKISIVISAAFMILTAACSQKQNEISVEMNPAIEVLKTRRSIRAYEERMPEKVLIDQVVEAGTYAPTGMGKQSPIIVAITDKTVRDRLSKLNADIAGTESDPVLRRPGGFWWFWPTETAQHISTTAPW